MHNTRWAEKTRFSASPKTSRFPRPANGLTLPTMKRITFSLLTLLLSAAAIAAQPSLAEKEREFVDHSGDGMYYTFGFIVIAGLGVAFLLWKRSQKGKNKPEFNYQNRYQDYYSRAGASETESVDAEKELEWLRKAKKGSKSDGLAFNMKKKAPAPKRTKITATNSAGLDEEAIDTKAFQEKMRKMQYAQLPINTVSELAPASQFEPLPISNDDALLNAIEQANEEYEEDTEVRELALKILTAFRTRNSVEALSQMALYDLSSNLRSKSVGVLTDFDHEMVFETILLACADPTREVRAAAARGLFRLSFDRADAWKRIIETKDEYRMRHAARAAVEAGIVTKAFERLIHEDLKIAYEAIVLVALMIEADETKEIFDAIRTHKDERVRFALVHVLKLVRDERTAAELQALSTDSSLPTDVADRVREAVKSFEAVTA